MSAVTNAERAQWARNALSVFTLEVFYKEIGDMRPADLDNAVTDLICDLMHFADQNGMDAEEVADNARSHYYTETSEDS